MAEQERQTAEQEQKQTTSPKRDKVVNEFVKHLTADGAPGEVVLIYKAMGDGCYCAFCAGKMAAQRMELEGDIEQDQVFEVAMEFAKIIAMKITLAPRASELMRPQTGQILNVPGGPLEPPRR